MARVWEPEGPQALGSTSRTRRAKAGSLAAQTSLQLAHAPAEHGEPIGAALVVHGGCQGGGRLARGCIAKDGKSGTG
jgi:hypothetical protein